MIYIFDVDGTLTKSRNKMDLSFAQFFYDFTEHNRVWLISGSDKDGMELVTDVLSHGTGIT